MPSAPTSTPKNSIHGVIIALAILNAVGLLVMYFKLDMLDTSLKEAQQETFAEMEAAKEKITTSTSNTQEQQKMVTDSIRLDADGQIALSLQSGQTAAVTWLNCGAALVKNLTLMSVSNDGVNVNVEGKTITLTKGASTKILTESPLESIELVSNTDTGSASFLWKLDCGEVGP